MQEVISVIIPVYNVQRYLEQCMESVINQTYRNLEIILIDDGSTDDSGKICDDYAQRDERIIVIHQKNGGAAAAKNTGLKIASGKYLTFVDSDDYLEQDAYTYMVSMLRKHNADVIQCAHRNIFIDRQEEYYTSQEFKQYHTEDYLKCYTTDWTCGLLWDKLYVRELYRGVFFEEGHIIDDEFFTYQGVMNASKVLYSPHIVYNYRKRKSSVMVNEKNRERIVMDTLDYIDKRRKNIVSRYPELEECFDNHFLDMLTLLINKPDITKKNVNTIKKRLKQYEREKHNYTISVRKKLQLIRLKWMYTFRITSNGPVILEEQEGQNYYE